MLKKIFRNCSVLSSSLFPSLLLFIFVFFFFLNMKKYITKMFSSLLWLIYHNELPYFLPPLD